MARSRRGATFAFAVAVQAVALAAAVVPSLAARGGEGQDVLGPLNLAQAKFDQHNTDAILSVRTHGSMPSLKDLTTSPSHIGSKDERYLCLQAQGRKSGRNLYCPGGSVSHNRITLGYGTYGKSGTVKHRDDLSAKILDRADDAITLKFPLDRAGLVPGKIDWRVISGWTGNDCVPPPPTSRHRAPKQGSGGNLCLDSIPNDGFVAGRINPVAPTGCKAPAGEFTHGPSGKNEVGLSFDDGPSAYTESVLRILDKYNAHATFFEIGSQVAGGASAARDILASGNELGNHSWAHENIPSYGSLKATSNRIEQVTGFRPCEFRPPYGAVNSGLVADARSLGMSTILWDVDPRDWSTPGTGAIYSNVVANTHAGSIVLLHDGGGNRSETVAALPGILKNFKKRGFKVVTITDLLGGRVKLEEVH